MAFSHNPLSGRLIVVIGTVLSVPAALFMGRLAAQGNTSQIGLILAGLFGMLFLLGLQDKVWWLIPIAFGNSRWGRAYNLNVFYKVSNSVLVLGASPSCSINFSMISRIDNSLQNGGRLGGN